MSDCFRRTEEFFLKLVSDFNVGRSGAVGLCFRYPLLLEMGYASLYLGSIHDFIEMNDTYRDNLDTLAFDRAEITFDHHEHGPGSSIRTLLTWHLYNRSGHVFRTVPGCYFSEPTAFGSRLITSVDLLVEPFPPLTSGLPLR